MILDEICTASSLVCLWFIAPGLVFMNGKRLHHRSRESRIIINNNSKLACAAPSSCSNSSLPQCSVSIILQDQIDDEPIRFTTPIPPLRNQAILATTAISVSSTPYTLQYF